MKFINIFLKGAQTWEQLLKRRTLEAEGSTETAMRVGASFIHANFIFTTYGVFTTGFNDLVKAKDS